MLRIWARVRAPLPDQPLAHATLLTYLSDYGPVVAAHVPINAQVGTGIHVSLNHSVWFHRPIRMDDDRVRIDYHAISNAASRGFVRTQSGSLVATFTQEVRIRPSAQ